MNTKYSILNNLKHVLFFILICFLTPICCEIRFIFEMFRHGARAPMSLDKEGVDIFGEKWNGNSELTDVGMRQHYLLGYRNRIIYNKFISNSYDNKEIYVISTNTNRTIMSAYSQLQGLYPPGTGPNVTQAQANIALPPVSDVDYNQEQQKLANNSLKSELQVLPIHIFDEKANYFSLTDQDKCPGVHPLQKENEKKKVVKDFYAKFLNSSTAPKLKKVLNVTDDYFTNFYHMHDLCDSFVCGYTDKRKLNPLKEAGIDFEEFYSLSIEFLFINTLEVVSGDDENKIAIASMSPIVLDIVNWMDNRVKNDINNIGYNGYPNSKFIMYSAHDDQMGAIQNYLKTVLNITNLHYTFFASNIFFEIHRPDSINLSELSEKNYTVRIVYNGYENNFNYIDFKSLVFNKSMNSEQIANFCKFKKNSDTNDIYFIIAVSVLGLITIILLISTIVLISRNKKIDASRLEYNSIV
jgi:hypothetical protein